MSRHHRNRAGGRTREALGRRDFLKSIAAATAVSSLPAAALSRATAARLRASTPQAPHHHVQFDVRSVRDGDWSDPRTWEPARAPQAGERVLISRDTRVAYDVESDQVIRFMQVAGKLVFARDRDTRLEVGILKVQDSDACTETGFACDLLAVNERGEPLRGARDARTLEQWLQLPALEVGTPDDPIPAEHTARIRLHYIDGMDEEDAPAIVCCSARMDLHGAPLSRTWVKLGADVVAGDTAVELAEQVSGWRIGDEVIVTGSEHQTSGGRFRHDASLTSTELRRIAAIDGRRLMLDRTLEHPHFGSGAFRSEVANLSRNVIVESADPNGPRGHTMYHRYSAGGISYARFAHLGKEGVLGRYAIHFHLVGDTMRGSSVVGVAVVDSHNRWITIHGTHYLVVRDCVGYRSVGHGFFLEDGTETYNVLDRNLGVQAFHGRPLPQQALPFDPNDGAAFWWANGRNTLVRNTACENDEYGFRYDSQNRSNFDSRLYVPMPDGSEQRVDIRTIPFYRFEHNESHTEGLYGMVVAGTDRAAPDTRHPHVLKNLKIWQVHYGLRSQVPCMWIENVEIDHAAYGIYRPEFENHVYRNLHIAHTNTEPFNRGLDDQSAQHGVIAVDGLRFSGVYPDSYMPLIQISDNNPEGRGESHFRNLDVVERMDEHRRRALVNRGGGPRPTPETPTGVPIYIHGYYGPGRHAKVVSTAARDFGADGLDYREDPPLTGDESRAAEVRDILFPTLLDPVDDLAPATVITWPVAGIEARLLAEAALPDRGEAGLRHGTLVVRGTTTDNTETRRVHVRWQQDGSERTVEAQDRDYHFHQWEARLEGVAAGELTLYAYAEDAAGNTEQTGHELRVRVQ